VDHTTPEARTPQDWVEEGLISFEQAEAIEGDVAPWDPPRLVEVLLYLGLAAFSIATLIWFFDLLGDGYWTEPNRWGGFAVVFIAACVFSGLAYILNRDSGGIRRAVGALLATAVLMLAIALGAAFDAIEFTGQWAQLVMSLLVAAAAIGAWWLRKSVPTELALFLGVTSVLVAVIELIQEASFNTDPYAAVSSLNPATFTGTTAGILMWLLGCAWIWLGYRRMLRSPNTAYLLGGATAAFAAIGLTTAVNRWWIILLAVTALALCAASVYLQNSLLMVVGVITVMISVPLGLSGWLQNAPAARTWVMIYGIPGLLVLVGSVVWADRIRTAE